jgi:hypothetical protein
VRQQDAFAENILAVIKLVSFVALGVGSESLRVAGVDRDKNVLITFLVALGLILLVLWLLPRPFLTLKEETGLLY